MDASIAGGGGKACFRSSGGELIDCASWGSYSGDDTGSGTPFNAPIGLTPDRSMTRDVSGGANAEGDFEGCFAEAPVQIQRRGSGRFTTVKRTTTDAQGAYRVAMRNRPGTYRARAPELKPSEEHRCLAAVSPRRHNGWVALMRCALLREPVAASRLGASRRPGPR